MPAIMTHYAFAKMRVPTHPEIDVLTLGGQGPDVFFFYGYNIKKRLNIKEVRDFGTLLHHVDISKAYYFLLEYANKKEGKDKEVLNSFIYGLFLHYILDRNCHPYVFYRTGFSDQPDEGKYYFGAHASFEAHIDTLIKDHQGIKIAHRKAVEACDQKVKLISSMMKELAEKVFDNLIIKEDTYYLAWKDMKFCQVLFYSPIGVKKAIMRAFSAKSSLNAMISPPVITHNDVLDILNEQKSVWRDCISNEGRHESFLELIAKANEEVDELDKLLAKQYTSANLKAFVRNVDHDGFQLNAKKVYFDNVWLKVKNIKW